MDDIGGSGLSRQDLKKIKTQRGLRAAAFELFNERGYRAVSIDDIAAKANVSRTTFFNYFSSKEGVITDPDILDLAEFARTTEKVPQGQGWWPSVTAVLIESLINSKEWCEFKKRISVLTPDMNHLFQKASGHYVAVLQVWLLKRVNKEQHEFTKLQLQVAMAVIETTYDTWNITDPYEKFVDSVRNYFDMLGRAFDRGLAPEAPKAPEISSLTPIDMTLPKII